MAVFIATTPFTYDADPAGGATPDQPRLGECPTAIPTLGNMWG